MDQPDNSPPAPAQPETAASIKPPEAPPPPLSFAQFLVSKPPNVQAYVTRDFRTLRDAWYIYICICGRPRNQIVLRRRRL